LHRSRAKLTLARHLDEIMKINQLRMFVAVVESKSIHRAASALGISQPAVSMAIRELESNYGASLLIRKTKGVEVTTHGALLHRRGRAILADLDRVNEEMARLQSERGGVVSIAVSSVIACTVLPDVLLRFREKMPNIQVRISETWGRDALIDGLVGGEFDFAMVLTAPYFYPLPDDIERLAEINIPLILGARTNHPLARSTSISELMDVDWLIPFENTDQLETSLENDFAKFGLKIPSRPIRCHSFSAAMEIFEKMDLIGVFSQRFADIQFQRYDLVQIKIRETLPMITAGIFQRQPYIQTEAAEYFIECFRAAL
jgi:LysR family transcriptional regulator, regulator of abg operon